MEKFLIFSKPNCPACDSAKKVLSTKGLLFEEFVLDVGQPKQDGKQYISRDELLAKIPGARTVPQIFKGETLIGGYNELMQAI